MANSHEQFTPAKYSLHIQYLFFSVDVEKVEGGKFRWRGIILPAWEGYFFLVVHWGLFIFVFKGNGSEINLIFLLKRFLN